MIYRLIFILLIFSNFLFANTDSLVTLEIDAQDFNSVRVPKAICRQSELVQKFKEMASKSWQKSNINKSLLATQNAVAVINTSQDFRVDEGARTISFILKYQRSINIGNSDLLINVWVDEQKYYDQDQDKEASRDLGNAKARRLVPLMFARRPTVAVGNIGRSGASSFGNFRQRYERL